jgi:putative Ca2+/H+ antiporter (TMEM165/GDT1 family)
MPQGRSRRGETDDVAFLPGRAEERCVIASILLPGPGRPAMPQMLTALFTSTGVVALAEMGDKTQLLAIVLATRFRRPWLVVAGILVATLANHALAAWAGSALADWLDGPGFRYAVAASFIAMAAWTLVPDTLDEGETPPPRYGAFLTTLVAFFIVEMGDKTQIATVALGARFDSVLAVTIGTTLGMMLANVPAVFLGNKLVEKVPLRTVHIIAALVFLGLGLWLLAQTAGILG